MVPNSDKTFAIADLSRELGVTARTLRFYEDQGMISPMRIGQSRAYSHSDKARLMWILKGKSVGFSLLEISEMLDLYDLGDGRITQREVTLKKCQDRLQTLKQQRNDIDHMISDLKGFCDILEDLVQDAQGGYSHSRTSKNT
jgi:DNA-binding transcriptional MerR regulator